MANPNNEALSFVYIGPAAGLQQAMNNLPTAVWNEPGIATTGGSGLTASTGSGLSEGTRGARQKAQAGHLGGEATKAKRNYNKRNQSNGLQTQT
jgi:hypothetical protein